MERPFSRYLDEMRGIYHNAGASRVAVSGVVTSAGAGVRASASVAGATWIRRRLAAPGEIAPAVYLASEFGRVGSRRPDVHVTSHTRLAEAVHVHGHFVV
jgi:hypothetical protein